MYQCITGKYQDYIHVIMIVSAETMMENSVKGFYELLNGKYLRHCKSKARQQLQNPTNNNG